MKKKPGKKKLIIITAVIAVVLLVGINSMGKDNGTVYQEVAVETRDITTYLEFSGNVEAVNVSNVYPDTSAKVLEVLVSEGDEVKAGDVIALLDSGDTEYNISMKEAALELSKLSNSYNIKDSQTNLNNLSEQVGSGLNASLNSSQQTLLSAQENYQKAADKYNTAKAEYDTETTPAIVSAKQNLKTAQLNYNNVMSQHSDEFPISDEAKAVQENSLQIARDNLEDAKITAKEEVDDYYEAFLEAEKALLDAEKSYETTALSVEQNIENASASLEKTQALSSEKTAEMELEHLKESLKDYTIYAPIDGYITDLNVKKGEYVANSTAVAEVTDLSTMQASIKIDEYDVSKVSTGENVQIYINALDKTYEGKIASIAKKATIQNDISYLEAVVEFDTNDAVSSGLSAEIKLIKSDEKGVMALPVDVIEYDVDNSSYVLVKGDDGVEVKTPVKLGVSDGSYVQILEGLKEDDIILTIPKMDFGMMMEPAVTVTEGP